MASTSESPRSSRWPFWRALLLGALLVALLTAPTLTRLTSVGRLDTDDGRFSIWNVAWIGHALLTSPGDLLDANIFWPHQGTLAYSELNLVAGLLGLPWYAATRNSLAALNGSAATALVLSFMFMWALVRRLTGSDGAGLVSATAFTFSPFVAARTPHIQLLMVFVFPMVFLAYDRYLERPGLRRACELGAALALGALACGYYGIFAGAVLVVAALVFARRQVTYWVNLAVAAVVAGLLLFPVYWAFTSAREASGSTMLHRSTQSGFWSATWADYFASSSIAHEWWLPMLRQLQVWQDVLFPGILVLALAGLGVPVLLRRRPRLLWAYLAMAAVACWASFGPRGGLYSVMEVVIPPMSLLRAPSRFGIVVTFAAAVIAGFGVARLELRRRWIPAVLVLLVACELGVKTEEWGYPSWPLRTVPPLSPAYRALARLPRGPLVEYPFAYDPGGYHRHAWPMFWSTYHWQPLVNGYSDVIPPAWNAIALPINGFPDPVSFDIMKARGVKYVLWHIDTYDERSRRVLVSRFPPYRQYLRLIIQTPDIWLYEIVGWP